jgi:hypothetical protein
MCIFNMHYREIQASINIQHCGPCLAAMQSADWRVLRHCIVNGLRQTRRGGGGGIASSEERRGFHHCPEEYIHTHLGG